MYNQQIFEITDKKFTVADIFHKACDYLEINGDDSSEKSKFSCDTIRWAVFHFMGYSTCVQRGDADYGIYLQVDKILEDIVYQGMEEMGFSGFSSLDVYNDVALPQQARFIWLTWLAMMAEEQGV